jgi:uncharacterized protein YdcH (DUF465 family)
VTLLPSLPEKKTRRIDPMEHGNSEIAVTDPEFLRLREEHRHHEERLHQLAGKTRLSEDEEMEEKRLKKEKLLLKDRMEAIARHRREELPS